MEKRGQRYRRCKCCRMLGYEWHTFMAQLKTMPYWDTRIISLMSGAINMTWSLAVYVPFMLKDEYPTGYLARLIWEAPLGIVLPVMLSLGICETWSSVRNSYVGRKRCSFLGLIWWLWMTLMAFTIPPNETAGWIFLVITLFRSWTFVTIENTHPHGKHFPQKKEGPLDGGG